MEIEKIFEQLERAPQRKVNSVDFDKAVSRHRNDLFIKIVRWILLKLGELLFPRNLKARRFSRRLLFEFSWRFLGKKTYMSNSLVGRAFFIE